MKATVAQLNHGITVLVPDHWIFRLDGTDEDYCLIPPSGYEFEQCFHCFTMDMSETVVWSSEPCQIIDQFESLGFAVKSVIESYRECRSKKARDGKLDVLIDKVNILLVNNIGTDVISSSNKFVVNDYMKKHFRLESIESLEKFEENLRDDNEADYFHTFVMAKLRSDSLSQSIRDILKTVMSNEVGLNFTMKGTVKKRAFDKTKIYENLSSAAQSHLKTGDSKGKESILSTITNCINNCSTRKKDVDARRKEAKNANDDEVNDTFKIM